MNPFMLYERAPFALNIIAGPVISYITILMNIVIFVVLFDKRIKTPSTVIMQALAVSDSLTALCTYAFEPFFSGIYIYYEAIKLPRTYCNWDKLPVVTLEYPYCILHYGITQLADNFHLASVFLTTCLGLQKLIAVSFPIWSRRWVTLKMSVIISCICFLLSLFLHIPRMFVVSFNKHSFSSRNICSISKPHGGLNKYVLTDYPILIAIIIISAVVVMMLSTTFIIFTLIRRKHLRGHSSASKYERKSSVLIMCVLVVFLVSEIPSLYVNIKLINTYADTKKDYNVVYVLFKEISKRYKACSIQDHNWNQEYCKNLCLYFILATAPYSEKMNYLLSINLVEININSLQHMKLLMEMLKISTIIGCASNFIIYVLMSEKLRNTLSKKFKFWKRANQAEGFEMR